VNILIDSAPDLDLKQAFERETRLWSMLRHKNVVRLLGIASADSSPPLVTPWMENGTIVDYLKKHPSTDRLSFVRG
jgi:serine/threonine protein kinase